MQRHETPAGEWIQRLELLDLGDGEADWRVVRERMKSEAEQKLNAAPVEPGDEHYDEVPASSGLNSELLALLLRSRIILWKPVSVMSVALQGGLWDTRQIFFLSFIQTSCYKTFRHALFCYSEVDKSSASFATLSVSELDV